VGSLHETVGMLKNFKFYPCDTRFILPPLQLPTLAFEWWFRIGLKPMVEIFEAMASSSGAT
jgi:hypothetical protein